MKLYVTVTLGIILHHFAASNSANHPPQKKYHYRATRGCCLRFVLKPVFSQATRGDIEDEQIHPAASRRPLRTSIKSKIDFQHVSWYKMVKNYYIPQKMVGLHIYIYPSSGTIPTSIQSSPMYYMKHNGHINGSLMGLRGKQHRSFVFN